MAATWSVPLGILIYLIAIIFAIIFYFKYKKVFMVLFTASVATYVFGVFYAWDVFSLDKNYVLLMLVISTIVMILLGRYFSKLSFKPVKPHTSLKEK